MTPIEQSVAYAKGDTAKQHAFEDGFVAGVSYQIEKEANKIVLGKEPQYLYVYEHEGNGISFGYKPHGALNMWQTKIIGKIKLEVDDVGSA